MFNMQEEEVDNPVVINVQEYSGTQSEEPRAVYPPPPGPSPNPASFARTWDDASHAPTQQLVDDCLRSMKAVWDAQRDMCLEQIKKL